MKSKFALLLALFLLSFQAASQNLGNEWINYDWTYYKIKTNADEFYRIAYDSLANVVDADVLSGVIPENIRLYHRGEEVAIDLVGLEDGTFDSGDYIEFYGRRNDGTQDQELFYKPDDQIHQYYNLFSDETTFFLTFGPKEPIAAGKRMNMMNVSSDGLPLTTTHKAEILKVETRNFSFGQYYPVGNVDGETKLSLYDRGQMFTSREIMHNEFGLAEELNFYDLVVDGITFADQSYGNPRLTVQVVGLNNVIHNTSIFAGPSISELRVFKEELKLSYSNFGDTDQQIDWSLIQNDIGRLIVRVEEVSNSEIRDSRVAVGYVKLEYPQEMRLSSQDTTKLIQLYGSNSNEVIRISDVDDSFSLFEVTDYKHPQKVPYQLLDNRITAAVENDLNGRKYYLRQNSAIIQAQIEAVTFKHNDLSGANYLIISHPYLRDLSDASNDPLQDYIDYRSSVAGGQYQVGYADAPQLYDEFGYGEFTPLAIRRYLRKAYQEGDPKYLFIIGKSSRVDLQSQRLSDPLASDTRRELVPTMGAPGSDIVYVTGLDGQEHVPAFPVGRLSITRPDHLTNYLNKVVEKESTIKNSPWTKNFVQLSGGLTTSNLIEFNNIIEDLKGIVTDDYLGGNVNNISKQNNSAVENINISEEINEGAGFVFFIGHSSANFTDIDIGRVSDPSNGYNNQGKYPAFLVNGCRGGEIFYYSSFTEDWIRTANKGAVNSISHSDVGIAQSLRGYSEQFYELLADTLWMNRSIGDIQKETIIKHLNSTFLPDQVDYAMVEQNVLQGDPAIPIFGHDQVDYAINSGDIFLQSTDGKDIDASTQFFKLGIVVNNGGRTSLDSVTIDVTRIIYENDEEDAEERAIYRLPQVKIPPVRYQDTVYYLIENAGLDVFGPNVFEVVIDKDGAIKEGSKLNNEASIEQEFLPSGTFNVAPYAFETLSKKEVELVVQSSNLKLNDKAFIIEISDNKDFNGTWYQRDTLFGKGIGRWTVDLPVTNETDTARYYWRSVFQEESTQDTIPWAQSTFTYIRDGFEGWGQTTFDQFESLSLSSVAKDDLSRQWVFDGISTTMEVETFGADHPNGNNPRAIEILINGVDMFQTDPCGVNSINAIAFDKDSGRPYVILKTDGIDVDVLDPLICGYGGQPFLGKVINRMSDDLLTDINNSNILQQYVDGMAVGDYALLFNNGELNYLNWKDDVFEGFGSLGASLVEIGGISTGDPFIFFGEKGAQEGTYSPVLGEPNPGEANARRTSISYQNTIRARVDEGSIISPFIGPVSQWGTLTQTIQGDVGEDEWTFEVRGVNLNGEEEVLFANVTSEQLDLSTVDAARFPFIRMYVNMRDKVSATPPQLKRWLVSYQGVPEGIVSLLNEENQNVELEEGEPFSAAFQFTNVSEYDLSGPLNVVYAVRNIDKDSLIQQVIQIPGVPAGETVSFELPIETKGLVGDNNLELFVNPGDKLEQFYSNNRIVLNSFFFVTEDIVSPILDVTFDGVHIMEGDIVNAKPFIQMELRDNNKFNPKTDTAGIAIFMTEILESGNVENKILFSDPNLTFMSASGDRPFTVQYTPEELIDGQYELKARMADASSVSNRAEYVIRFEVVNESTVTNFYPYPNPFSTNTRFVFTLTGSEVPDKVKIQIFTVSGRLVREITQDEIGPIKIGNNITEYAWDGRDEFGDRLANGTYLYRVLLGSSKGTQFKSRGTKGDKGFNKGFGKIVILR